MHKGGAGANTNESAAIGPSGQGKGTSSQSPSPSHSPSYGQKAQNYGTMGGDSTNKENANSRQIVIKNGQVVLPKDENGNDIPFISNEIRTSKYTVVSFLPVNLFEQLTRPANFYFVIVAVLQSINAISISQGRPTILLPLLFVLFVSGVKDAFEDYKRHQDDDKENARLYMKLNLADGTFERMHSRHLKVGDWVKIVDDEIYPADILQVYASSLGGYSYVETANLDGETNLKIKMVSEATKRVDESNIHSLNLRVRCDAPNGKLDAFGGGIQMGKEKEHVLGLDNLLLRGSKLRNTGFVLGLVIFTGAESKIRMNSTSKSTGGIKRSSVEKTMNLQILGMFAAQVVFCFVAAVSAGIWTRRHESHIPYLELEDSPAVTGVLRFFTWFIVFAAFVPISLLVSMEMVKFAQGQFMGLDAKMAWYVGKEWQFARAQTSGLNEELGLIQFVLSDKTGTLTCNSMDFRKCIIGGVQYGTGDTDISLAARKREEMALAAKSGTPATADSEAKLRRTFSMARDDNEPEIAAHVNFNSRLRLQRALKHKLKIYKSSATPQLYVAGESQPSQEEKGSEDIIHPNPNLEEEFMLALALANTVFPTAEDDDPNTIALKASSPDEEALVEFARFCGYELFDRTPPNITIKLTLPGQPDKIQVQYEQLALLDFTSKRKRMTVVLRAPDGNIKVFSKGADNVISNLLKDEPQRHQHYDETMEHLAHFGDQGLRTLLVCSATHPASWWDDPNTGLYKQYAQVMRDCAIEGEAEKGHFKGSCKDECRRCVIEEKVEHAAEMVLVGATAIEDKLQDGVPATIEAMLKGGMNVWVLTGDKLETAINIGMACNLLDSAMEQSGNLLRIDGETLAEVSEQLEASSQHLEESEAERTGANVGLVMTSAALYTIMAHKDELMQRFWDVAIHCRSVVGCRMQPNQKAEVVKIVKNMSEAGVSTLAVGDGANDEQMIREADVGVGIRGVEGTTAVRASDYAISQFSFLRRLLFVHGRLSYRRISTLICYIFYKNALICLAQFWFGTVSGFSGQPFILEWAYQLYNIIFTGLPIMVFAVLDRDIPIEHLEKYPIIYSYSSAGQLFGPRIFWKWMTLSALHSGIIFSFPFFAFDSTSNASDGQSDGMWSMGVAIYSSIVVVTNLKLALVYRSWTWVHHLSTWGSILSFLIVMIILNLSPVFSTAGGDYTYLVFRLLGLPKFWATLFLTVCTCLLVDFGLEAYSQLSAGTRPQYLPADVDTMTEPLAEPSPTASRPVSSSSDTFKQETRSLPRSMPKAVSDSVVTKSGSARVESMLRAGSVRRHTGFDFSHTGGQAQRLGFPTFSPGHDDISENN